MTDSEQRHIEDDGVTDVERNKQKERSTQKKSEELQAINKYNYQNIDEMRIIDLKEALRMRNLPRTGNKIELKKRLLEAIRQDHDLSTMATELRENRIINKECTSKRKEVTDRNKTTDDNETSDEDVADKEKRSEQSKAHRRRMKGGNDTILNDKERHYMGTTQYEEDESKTSDTSTKPEINQRNRRRNADVSSNSDYLHNNFTIKDVEGSLTYFSGDDKLPIEKWITEFEDMSALLQWNDLQKLIYAKRMLKGSAKRFVSFEKGVTSWKTLKRKLKDEFRIKINSATVHNQLFKRRRQAGESSRQYIYAMQEIADQGYIEEDALIQYIVDGIPNEEGNKTLLYEARTLRELKKKLEVYDRIKEKAQRKKTTIRKDGSKDDSRKERNKSVNKQSDKKRCFNCGSTEHNVKNCTNADKGPKCFKCNNFGHIALKCQQAQSGASTTTVSCINTTDDKFILVDIAGLKC